MCRLELAAGHSLALGALTMSKFGVFLIRSLFWCPVTLVVILLADHAYVDSSLAEEWRNPFLVPYLIGGALLASMLGCLIMDTVFAAGDRGRQQG